MDISPAAFLFIVLGAGVVSLIVGLRLGVRAGRAETLSEDEQVKAALGVLKRHFEKKALAQMEASGAPLWSPDRARVAELTHGSSPGAPVEIWRNAKADKQSSD